MKFKSARRLGGVGLLALMIGCGDSGRNGAEAPAGAADVTNREVSASTAPPGAAVAPEAQAERVVLFVGTSLTAGYGLPENQSFPLLIQQRLEAERLPFRAINAGVSGETSSGALRRIDWLLQQPFDVFVLETGGNDMLRGTDPEVTESNIQAIIDRVRTARPDAQIILAGMLAMPNLGREYTDRFESIYPRLAERNDLPLIPFLLEGVAAERELNLADGIHPNAEGQRIVADNVWEVLEPVLEGRLAGGEQSTASDAGGLARLVERG